MRACLRAAPASPPLQELALDAVKLVSVDHGDGQKEIDVKQYAKVEKIPGGTIEDCKVLRGECSGGGGRAGGWAGDDGLAITHQSSTTRQGAFWAFPFVRGGEGKGRLGALARRALARYGTRAAAVPTGGSATGVCLWQCLAAHALTTQPATVAPAALRRTAPPALPQA